MTTAKQAKTVVIRYGFGPLTTLGFIFVLCKIFAVGPIAAWSWWLVLLPFYLGFAIFLTILLGIALFFLGGVICIFIGALFQSIFAKRRLRQLQADIVARRRF